MASALHLVKRFVTALKPGPPSPADEEWARAQLLDAERQIWNRMSKPDRRHAVGVARAVVAQLEVPARTEALAEGKIDRPIVAAALLHDCGKIASSLGTPARVVATLWWAVAPDDTADRWLTGPDGAVRTRLGQYRRHPELGAELLTAAGSDPFTAAWAGEHHRPEHAWSVPLDIGRVLKACDDD